MLRKRTLIDVSPFTQHLQRNLSSLDDIQSTSGLEGNLGTKSTFFRGYHPPNKGKNSPYKGKNLQKGKNHFSFPNYLPEIRYQSSKKMDTLFGQRPRRGRSPVEHRGNLSIRTSVHPSVRPPQPHPQGFVSFGAYSDPNSAK